MIASTMELPEVVETEETTAEVVESPEVKTPDEPAVSTEQANKAIGKVTLYDECVERIVHVQADIDHSEEQISELKTLIKNLREDQKADYAKLRGLNADLRDIKNGQYQRKLFSGLARTPEKPKPVDPGLSAPIDLLGMTEKENELLIAVDIKTVADLEKRMREDNLWHRKIKGYGDKKVDKLSDQLLAWRLKNPVPSEEDESEDDEDDPIATDCDSGDVVAEADDEDAEELEGMDAFDMEGEETQGDE